jgi:phage baseplate assembly protein W
MTDPGAILGRGISFPPRVGADGRVAWSEGEANIREAIQVILRTAPGERLRLGRFGAGLDRLLFEPNTTATRHQLGERIRDAVAEWEPRVTVQSVQVDADPADPESAVATVEYRLVATQAVARLSLSVALGG